MQERYTQIMKVFQRKGITEETETFWALKDRSLRDVDFHRNTVEFRRMKG